MQSQPMIRCLWCGAQGYEPIMHYDGCGRSCPANNLLDIAVRHLMELEKLRCVHESSAVRGHVDAIRAALQDLRSELAKRK